MNQSQTSRILQVLKTRIDSLPPKLKSAAKYIIDNPGDFGLDPVRVTACKIGISANSLVRLAEMLGFETFDALRDPFRTALLTSHEMDFGQDWLDQMAKSGPTGQLQAKVAQNEINIVSRSLRLMTPERVQAITAALTSAQRCYVTATRASYALAYYFHYVGRMALPNLELVPRHMGSAVDDLQDMQAEDCLLAFTFAPYSAETIQALKMAKSRGAKLVVISDSEVIAPGISPDHVLAVAANSLHPFGCYAGAMVVLECLLSHLIEAGGKDAHQRIADYEALRRDTGAYWTGPKLPRISEG